MHEKLKIRGFFVVYLLNNLKNSVARQNKSQIMFYAIFPVYRQKNINDGGRQDRKVTAKNERLNMAAKYI